jgi:mannosylglycoprotein endo-beta-mannosidase
VVGAREGEHKERQFFLERQWFKAEGFMDLVTAKWKEIQGKCPEGAYSLEKWHGGVAALRNVLKGWGCNIRGEYRRRREDILGQIRKIDDEEGGGDVTQENSYEERSLLEEELERLMEAEDCTGNKEGGQWSLEGDSNTTFFHLVANGRRRKN